MSSTTSDASGVVQPLDHQLDDGEMTPAQLAEAKAYGRLELICDLADKLLDVGYLAVMALVFAPGLDRWLAASVPSFAARLSLMFLITIDLHLAISFPLSYYSGYVLEHRFGLSRQTFGRWLWRYAKQNGLAIIFGLLLFLGLYGLIYLAGARWWLVAALAFFLVSVVIGQLMPVVILPLFYKIERLDAPELRDRMMRLASGTGLSIEGVYRMGLSADTVKANAMLAGLGRTRRVLMGDTLLDSFSPEEIEVIFAHEIGHHVYKHIVKLVALGVVMSATGFWICDAVVRAWVVHHEGAVTYQPLPVYTLPLVMLSITVFGLLLQPLQNILSRRFERQCDRYALRKTGLKAAYLSAFRKLAKLNKDDPAPNPVAVFLFHSHPPIAERLALAEEV